MDKYSVRLRPPKGQTVPALLSDFGTWLRRQPYGSVGWFGLKAEPVPAEWDPGAVDRLRRDGFAFLYTPDGSLLVLLSPQGRSAPVVVLLGSEGERETVATSLEELLVLLAEGETGVHDLDDEEAGGRKRLRRWLGSREITSPEAPEFDFQAYLDDAPSVPSPASEPTPASSTTIEGFPPFLRQLASMVGRRADDPGLVAFITQTLGKKVPGTMNDASGTKYVTAKKLGVEMAFSHDVLHAAYPLLNKSKRSYVPYLSTVWLNKSLPEPLPLGLEFGLSEERITAILGTPAGTRGIARTPIWKQVLDVNKAIVLVVALGENPYLQIDEAHELSSRHGVPSLPVVGLFVAWAIVRDLIDTTRFPEHERLISSIRGRKAQGSSLLAGALPRGIWDIHLKDLPELRDHAFGWFHNLPSGTYIRDDLVTVFGGREGPHGHEEPVLDDDTWEAVERAAPTLDRRFARWISSS